MIERRAFSFVTGNPNKVVEASLVCNRYGITIMQDTVDIVEIQSHNPIDIAVAKAKEAHRKLGRTVLVNDSSWGIPSLNGFPGGYMHSVNRWFTAEDFIALMRNKTDRRVTLTDTIVKYSSIGSIVFRQETTGYIAEEARGTTGAPSDQVIVLGDEYGRTIAERRESGEGPTSGTIELWRQFCEQEIREP